MLFGIPMYSNAAGLIPIVEALLEKGAALGTVLAFTMAVIALSLPEIIILKKVLKWQLVRFPLHPGASDGLRAAARRGAPAQQQHPLPAQQLPGFTARTNPLISRTPSGRGGAPHMLFSAEPS